MNENKLEVYSNVELGAVRILETAEGKILFCGADVAKALGYSNPYDALTRHCKSDGVVKHEGVSKTTNQYGKTTEQIVEMKFITEGNVYRLITHSKLPNAERFESWVFDEVLPAIRKHGAYMTPDTLEKALYNPDFLIRLATELKDTQAHVKHLEAKIDNDKPKVIFADAVSTSKTSILIGDLAKIIKQNGIDIGQKRLFAWLRDNGYLIKRNGSDYNMPTQCSMELGLFEVKETIISRPDGHVTVNKTPKVTGKGQQYFINKFIG